jgi:hypothetical protein
VCLYFNFGVNVRACMFVSALSTQAANIQEKTRGIRIAYIYLGSQVNRLVSVMRGIRVFMIVRNQSD